MAKNRFLGASGVLSIDVDGGASYSQVTVCRNVQLPPSEHDRIDTSAMDDTRAEVLPGNESESEFSFEIQHDPDDTVDASLRTAKDAKDECSFKFESTDAGGDTTLTITWSGYIVGMTPVQLDRGSPVAMQVTGVRSSDITEAVT